MDFRFKPLAVLIACTLPAAATNVIFMVADDLGYMDVGCNNPNTFYETPNIDSLAGKGLRFTAGYAACQVCSPTRSSILTGQYPARTKNTDYFGAPNGYQELPADAATMIHGSFGKQAKYPVLPAPYLERLAASHTTMAEAFLAKGYATMSAGKWHLGPKGSWPEDHGFQVNAGGTDSGGPYGGKGYFSPYKNSRLPDGPDGESLPDRLATEVSKFITLNKDKPFFVYFPFYSVHTPLMAPQELIDKYVEKHQKLGLKAVVGSEPPREVRQIQEHSVYAAMVEEMDRAVGKVLRTLDENQLAEDTIVIFFSDNGGLSTAEGAPTSNLPFRGGKGWMYEGGIREPLIIRWPQTIKPGGTCETPIISTDFYPTLLQACGFELLPEQHKDGSSFLELLKDPTAKHERAPLFWHYPHWGNQGGIPSSAVRDGDWKLIEFYWKKGFELYDLSVDPGEHHDLVREMPDKVASLKAKLETFKSETGAFLPSQNPNADPGFNKW